MYQKKEHSFIKKCSENKNMDSCKDNLKNCGAICCKWLVFIEENTTDSTVKYYEYHGCVVKRTKNRLFKIYIPLRCNKLSEDNLCTLHGTDKKPYICNDFNEKTKKKKNYEIHDLCRFK